MFSLSPPPIPVDAIADAKAYLRIDTPEEDAALAAMLGGAVTLAESFLNSLILVRTGIDRLPASAAWQRLNVTPVRAISGVIGIPAEGSTFPLAVDAYALDIDASGDGWVRIITPGAAGRVDVTVEAGLASDWAALPDAVRLAVLRLTGHLHAHRDAPDDAGPPAAVAALLRPYRRMRL